MSIEKGGGGGGGFLDMFKVIQVSTDDIFDIFEDISFENKEIILKFSEYVFGKLIGFKFDENFGCVDDIIDWIKSNYPFVDDNMISDIFKDGFNNFKAEFLNYTSSKFDFNGFTNDFVDRLMNKYNSVNLKTIVVELKNYCINKFFISLLFSFFDSKFNTISPDLYSVLLLDIDGKLADSPGSELTKYLNEDISEKVEFAENYFIGQLNNIIGLKNCIMLSNLKSENHIGDKSDNLFIGKNNHRTLSDFESESVVVKELDNLFKSDLYNEKFIKFFRSYLLQRIKEVNKKSISFDNFSIDVLKDKLNKLLLKYPNANPNIIKNIGKSKIDRFKNDFLKIRIDGYMETVENIVDSFVLPLLSENGKTYEALYDIVNIINFLSKDVIDLSKKFERYVYLQFNDLLKRSHDSHVQVKKSTNESESIVVDSTPIIDGNTINSIVKKELPDGLLDKLGNISKDLLKALNKVYIKQGGEYKKAWFIPFEGQLGGDFFNIIDSFGFKCVDVEKKDISEPPTINIGGTVTPTDVNNVDSVGNNLENKELKEILLKIKSTDNIEEKIDLIVDGFSVFYGFNGLTPESFKSKLLDFKSDNRIIKLIISILEKINNGQSGIPKPDFKNGGFYYKWNVGLTGFRLVTKVIDGQNCIVFFGNHDEYDRYYG